MKRTGAILVSVAPYNVLLTGVLLLILSTSSKRLFVVRAEKIKSHTASPSSLLRPNFDDITKLKKQYIQSGVSTFASFNIYAEYLRQKGEFPFSGYFTGFENDKMLDVIVDTPAVDTKNAIPTRNGRVLMELRPINRNSVQVKSENLKSLVQLVDHAVDNPGLVTGIRQSRLENLRNFLDSNLMEESTSTNQSQQQARKRRHLSNFTAIYNTYSTSK